MRFLTRAGVLYILGLVSLCFPTVCVCVVVSTSAVDCLEILVVK